MHGQKVFHKSEIGGVKVNIKEDDFDDAWEEIMKNVEEKLLKAY